MWKILLSRFKKNKSKHFIERLKECMVCEYNSKNSEKIAWYKRVLIWMSTTYSFITFNIKEDSQGNCTACQSCSIYYKAREEKEKCPKGKWKQ